MSTYKDMDSCLPFLKRKMQEEKEPIRKAGVRIAMEIIQALPSVEVVDGIACKDCFFYDQAAKRCCHNNGLQGRVRQEMYCSYGSRVYEDTQTEIDESKFAQFNNYLEEE